MNREWNAERMETMDKFLKWLSGSLKTGASIYRGQSNSDPKWRLQPSLDRILPESLTPHDWLKEEAHLECEFQRRAYRYLGRLERGYVTSASRLMHFMVMQHFGARTRLLDWTDSPAVASYFACVEDQDCDGTIWRVNTGAVVSYVDERWVKEWRFEREDPKNPKSEIKLELRMFDADVPEIVSLLYQQRLPFPRAQAQRALFTVGMPLGVDHESVLKRESGGDCKRIIIPAGLKYGILDVLERRLAIDAISLQYPGADRVGLRMAWDLEHKWK